MILKNLKFYTLSLLIFTVAITPLSSFAVKETLNITGTSKKINANKAKQYRNTDNLYVVILREPSVATFNAINSSGNNSAQLMANQSVRKSLDINSKANQDYRNKLISQQQQLLAQVNLKQRTQLKAEHSFQLAVNGFTARLAKTDLDALRSFSKVKTIQKIKPHKLSTNAGPQHINAPQVWQGNATGTEFKGEGVIVGIIDTGISAKHPSFAANDENNYQHINPLGEGVYLGDCALSEYQHYCNDKLIGIWSHPEITRYATYPGDDPIGLDVQGHGSHVASTVAGNIVKDVPVYNVIGDESEQRFSQISGVAPHANIISYQVCDLSGCWPDITALAVEHAIENGVQVINYSIGGEAISPWYSIDALAMLSARDAGIHVATSAGNMGPEESTLVSPGNAPWLTSVAAVSHGRTFTQKQVHFSGGNTLIGPFSGESATKGVSTEIVDGLDFDNPDCLYDFPENSLTDKIVVCRRGDIPRVEKGSHALSGNAAGMILINKIDGAQSINNDYHVLPSIHLSANNGAEIINWLNDGANTHNANFNDSSLIIDENAANIIAEFSSRGPEPVFNQYLAPHVAAPGVSIYAANASHQPHFYGLEPQPEYIFMDGTSMASPHVAGAFALIAGLKPNWTPAEAQSALMLTANSNTHDNQGVLNSYFDTGAGSIKIDDALNTSLVMNESNENFINADPNSGGDPQQLNLPALLGENCMIECSWQRTFKATTTGAWSVASVEQGEMNITVTPNQFNLANGEEITLTIVAKINEHYNGGYLASAIELVSKESNLTHPTLPIVASFKRGILPKNIEITANSNKGTAAIDGVITVATNTVTATNYDLSEVEKIQLSLQRDDSDNTIYPYNIFNDSESHFAKAFKIDLNTRYVEVNILKTSSPDLDLYIGSDWNYNGRPDSSYEMSSLICESATAAAMEKCVIEFPKIGNYFIAVHNYGDYQNPSNTVDDVELEIIKIGASDSIMTSTFNSSPEHLEDIDFAINWDGDLQQNKQYITAVDLGTSTETPSDIGFMPIRINRSDKTLSLGLSNSRLVIGETIELTLFIDGNNNGYDRIYDINLNIPEKLSVTNSSEDYSIQNNSFNLQLSMSSNSPAKQVSIHIDSSALSQSTILDLVLNYSLMENESIKEVTETFNPIKLIGIPTALINSEAQLVINVKEGETLTLSGLNSINPNTESALTYNWKQLSGLDLSISATQNSEITLSAPQVTQDSTATLELQVTSAGQSATTNATINIINVKEKSKSGGSTSYAFMLLLVVAISWRVKKKTNL